MSVSVLLFALIDASSFVCTGGGGGFHGGGGDFHQRDRSRSRDPPPGKLCLDLLHENS